jgi:hypothetical protein
MFSENFSISENNIIRVQLAQVHEHVAPDLFFFNSKNSEFLPPQKQSLVLP